tara:strand:+ start:8304 stop:8438 length:135 start_codon:yes stop_codon:yes gene_type:complete
MEQSNGNQQVNNEREAINSKIENYKVLGKSKQVIWNKLRRYRTI